MSSGVLINKVVFTTSSGVLFKNFPKLKDQWRRWRTETCGTEQRKPSRFLSCSLFSFELDWISFPPRIKALIIPLLSFSPKQYFPFIITITAQFKTLTQSKSQSQKRSEVFYPGGHQILPFCLPPQGTDRRSSLLLVFCW